MHFFARRGSTRQRYALLRPEGINSATICTSSPGRDQLGNDMHFFARRGSTRQRYAFLRPGRGSTRDDAHFFARRGSTRQRYALLRPEGINSATICTSSPRKGFNLRRRTLLRPEGINSATVCTSSPRKGRGTVATGGAESAQRRTQCNPWKECGFTRHAPEGQRSHRIAVAQSNTYFSSDSIP